MKKKHVKDSQIEMTELVLPNDTNTIGNLLGGRLMHWMDIAAGMAAQIHTNKVCVTAFVDELSFHEPIHLGEIVRLKASVNRAFKTSLEVGVLVIKENQLIGESKIANKAYFTFVALDENKKPVKVNEIIPRSQEEKRRYKEAFIRRKRRLERKNKGSA